MGGVEIYQGTSDGGGGIKINLSGSDKKTIFYYHNKIIFSKIACAMCHLSN